MDQPNNPESYGKIGKFGISRNLRNFSFPKKEPLIRNKDNFGNS